MIRIQCPSCQRKLKLTNPPRDKKVVCPKCSVKFKVKVSNTEDAAVGADAAGRESDDPFADIDNIIGRVESPPSPPPIKQAALGKPASPARAQVRPNRTPGNIHQLEASLTPWDDKLKRNGIGLLILSLGLVALPFFAFRVDELQAVLPVAPWVGIGIAFAGSFMLALSQRKKNLAAVLLAGVFLLLVATIGIGAHFLPPLLFDSTTASERADDSIDPDLAEDGWIVVDRDSLNNNPASQFVPPRRQPSDKRDQAKDDVPQPSKRASSGSVAKNRADVAESSFRPMEPIRRDPEPLQASGEIQVELQRATGLADNQRKREALQERVAERLQRGRVNRKTVQSPSELAKQFVLSTSVGRETVFGIAYFNETHPVVGFDVAYAKNRESGALDLIVPIVDSAEFADSVYPGPDTEQWVGLNVYLGAEGVLGLQGRFIDSQRGPQSQPSNGAWAGETPMGGDRVKQINTGNRRVHGVVVYKDQLKTVGLALILKR